MAIVSGVPNFRIFTVEMVNSVYPNQTTPYGVGAPVAQWVKRWPTDLAVPSSMPARGRIFSTVNGVPLHTAFHYQPLIVLI